jgi:LEA14-like dessication related protein
MKRRGVGILIAILLGLGLVLLNRKDLELVTQNKFLVRKISASGYELQSYITINNPNLLSSTIETIEEEYRINGHVVSIMKMQLDQGIPGRKETTFPVNVRFDTETFKAAFPADTVLTGFNKTVDVTGKVTYHNFTGGGTLEIKIQDELNLD